MGIVLCCPIETDSAGFLGCNNSRTVAVFVFEFVQAHQYANPHCPQLHVSSYNQTVTTRSITRPLHQIDGLVPYKSAGK